VRRHLTGFAIRLALALDLHRDQTYSAFEFGPKKKAAAAAPNMGAPDCGIFEE
jgi:hypothetical protein